MILPFSQKRAHLHEVRGLSACATNTQNIGRTDCKKARVGAQNAWTTEH